MRATARRPVTVYTRCATPLGRLRRWVNYRVLGYNSETCDTCGRRYQMTWWCADDLLFVNLAHSVGATGLLCPSCFNRAASALGLRLCWCAQEYDPQEAK